MQCGLDVWIAVPMNFKIKRSSLIFLRPAIGEHHVAVIITSSNLCQSLGNLIFRAEQQQRSTDTYQVTISQNAKTDLITIDFGAIGAL